MSKLYIIERAIRDGNVTHRTLNPCPRHSLDILKNMIVDALSKTTILEEPLPEIETLDDLLLYLNDLLIHFDTDPKAYIKDDYRVLVSIITKALIHLYKNGGTADIVTSWEDVLSDDKVPSEKLVKETIDLVASILADWEEEDQTKSSFILNKPTAITEEEIELAFMKPMPVEDVRKLFK